MAEALWFVGLIAFLVVVLLALIVGLFVFWIMMIVDCAKRNFKNDNEKIVWILILVFLQILGGVIYYFAIKKPNNK